ncbi:Chromate resistance protein ChrB [Clostridium grantii]|uniref:PaaX-like protein C-terminal domain-containing protein n=1 Tax=Clostridium grantii DSM 8605 TaxID=1121316 RepID=A0A1M5WHU0_9CLOT|nr:Chromate resistance protein ChrB [Clostridium grantii]SHH86803.1 PaaX-like protein C-terminal domain-containing protein [Clostridium grantii DSM 8605]
MEKIKWLVINYNLPTEPSRPRVAVWRKLKKLGAVNIQKSMWIIPNNDENYIALQKISEEVEANKGETLLMDSMFLDNKHQERVISIFNGMRDEEYGELIDECEKYLKELEKEISIEKFTFAELEEEEEELQKLISWYIKIESRNNFQASKGEKAKGMIKEIQESFENYSDLVYENTEKDHMR